MPLPTAIGEPDIWTTVPVVTYEKRGDFVRDANLIVDVVNKEAGSGKAIKRGYVLSKSDLVTPNVFSVAGAAAAKTLAVSGLPWGKDPADTALTQTSGTEDLSAGDNDKAVQVILRGWVLLKMGSAFQPGDPIMTDTNGDVQVYNGSDPDTACGFVYGKGGSFGYNQIRQGGAEGDLAMCFFNGIP